MPRSKSADKSVGKCGKAIGKAGSRLRRCGKKPVAKVHSIERRRWVPICAQHAAEFRRTFPGELESLKSVKAATAGDTEKAP